MTDLRTYSPLGFLNKFRQPKLKDQKKVNNEAITQDHIPYINHVTNSIIKTDNKDYIVSFELAGKAFNTLDEEDIAAWKDSLNNHIRTISASNVNVSFWTYIIREKIVTELDASFNNQFCQELNEKYLQKFSNSTTFINRLFLSISLKFSNSQAETIKILEDIISQLNISLASYGIKVLTTYSQNNIIFSQALEFYSYLINKEWIKIPLLNAPINTYLSINRLFFSNENIQIDTLNKNTIGAVLDIKEYNETTNPEQFNEFLSLPFEFTICQSFCSISKSQAKELLRVQKGHLNSAKDYGTSQILALDEALDDVESGRLVFGSHHCNIFVWSDKQSTLDNSVAKVKELLSDMGMIPKLVKPRPEVAFFASLHNPKYRLRPAPITSSNFACFANFHNYFLGKKNKNPWGEAVTIFETNHLTPVYFNFHEEENYNQTDDKALGNTLIIGQAGSGKTTVANFLLSNLAKFNTTTVFFDKDKGAKIARLAMGGHYFDLQFGKSTKWNPFQLDNTPENVIFLNDLIKTMLCHSNRTLTIKQTNEIEQAIKTLMSVDQSQRTLKNLAVSLPHNMHDDTGSRLKEWINQGQYAWLFDNETDELDFNINSIIGFDCTEFLEQQTIRTPLMMYLLHKMEQIIDGRRFTFFMDEFWKLLQDEIFTSFAKDKLKTIRKQNGLGVFMTQEPADAINSIIGKTIIQQTATQILLPNPKADIEDYIQGLKLTNTEFDLLKNFDVVSRQFLIKKSNTSTVAKLNLYGFKELKVLSGDTKNTILFEDLLQHNPNINECLTNLYQYQEQKI